MTIANAEPENRATRRDSELTKMIAAAVTRSLPDRMLELGRTATTIGQTPADLALDSRRADLVHEFSRAALADARCPARRGHRL